MRRRNKRLSKQSRTKAKRKAARRVSVGDVLGLKTPNRPKGANLAEARAMDGAEAAAERLNTNNKLAFTAALFSDHNRDTESDAVRSKPPPLSDSEEESDGGDEDSDHEVPAPASPKRNPEPSCAATPAGAPTPSNPPIPTNRNQISRRR